MKLPLSWLRDYLDELPPLEELAHRLTMAGLEVEEIVAPDPRLIDNLRVARIAELGPHPNADRLSVCVVDDGDGERRVVCGAKNMAAGDHVVLAVPGAVLPGGMKIKKSKIRGEESLGMLCSASELGISDDHDGIMILGDDVAAGAPAAALLGMDDAVLEIGVTPNRGDCLSVRGLAREIAAVCDLALSPRFSREPAPPDGATRFDVRIDSPEACALYCGIELQGVTIGPSPSHVAGRLAAAGIRAINNVVDVTNLVLIEHGQPLHAFDADRISGSTIGVRKIDGPQTVETLDGEERELIDGDLAIWDGEGPVAIAGVMGGARTAVHDATRRIFLESAWFRPNDVRATSRRLGLISESSYRFERGVDPAGVERALLAAAELIAELAGARVEGGVARAGGGVAPTPPIRLRPARVSALLGVDVTGDEARAILGRLGADADGGADADDLLVTVPSHRSDVTREVDLIEEVARVRGYDAIAEQTPRRVMEATSVPAVTSLQRDLRVQLAACGLVEAVGLAFCSRESNALFPGLHPRGAKPVLIRNPLNVETTELRRSVLPCLIDAHALNARNGVEATDLFTIGRTFALAEDGDTRAAELEVVGGLLWGPRRGRAPGAAGSATFWDVKAHVERVARAAGISNALGFVPVADREDYHPRACAHVTVDGKAVGLVGMVHPDVADALEISHEISIFEVDTRKLLEYAPPRSALQPIPRYPSSSRDVSLLVSDQTLAGEIIGEVDALKEPLIERVAVFDEYKGTGIAPGHRALAFQIVYRSPDGTLTDEEVTSLHERVIAHLVKTLNVDVRG